MGSMEELAVTIDPARNSSDAEDNNFRRRVYQRGKYTIPRRYVIAILLCLVLVIDAWKNMNNAYMFFHAWTLGMDVHILYPAISNWSWNEVMYFQYSSMAANICTQFPGALLLFITSSHKFLYTTVAISSILHMLTLVFVKHHSILFVVIHFSQRIISAPTRVAVLTMWKEWAPPAERTKLITLSLGGAYIVSASEPLFEYMLQTGIIRKSFYVSGACGLLWSLFWYVTISDTPLNDPKISETEFSYLQNSIPSTVNNTPKKYSPFTPIWILLFIGVLTASATTADVLVKKYRGHVLNIRKSFICGAFSVHAFLLLFLLFLNSQANMVFYALAYAVLSISVAGFCTIALDLSSRYVTIIGGIIETFYALGHLVSNLMINEMMDEWEPNSMKWIILHEIIVAILAVGIFIKWGSVEEQPWSFNSVFGRQSTNYQSYPKSEGEDNIKLVTDNL